MQRNRNKKETRESLHIRLVITVQASKLKINNLFRLGTMFYATAQRTDETIRNTRLDNDFRPDLYYERINKK